MKRFTHHAEPWGDFLDVKVYDKKINTARYQGRSIQFGSVTDVYNPFEKKYQKTRKILEQFVDCDLRVELLTKSDLVVRDIEILKRIPRVRVGISLNTLDDGIRKKTEPGAPSIARRMGALKALYDAGIDNYLFISPMFPQITDFKEIITQCKSFVKTFAFENLNLRGAYYPRVMNYIRDYHRDLLPLYREIYTRKNKQYWEVTETEIRRYCEKNNINYISYFYHEKIRKP
jgi:DNA repair photolyase